LPDSAASSRSEFFHIQPHGLFCQSSPLAHDLGMKFSLWPILPGALALFLSACSNTGGVASGDHPTGTGPFDSAGNYREEWADDPSKWRRPGRAASSSSDDAPVIAKNEQPPADSTPLASSAPAPSKPKTSTIKPIPEKPTKVAVSKPQESARAEKNRAKADKPKPSVAKTKPKAKPKAASSRYTVKKGDTLSAIASRNGTTVSAIKSANRISGTMIRNGQTLVIPKR
jgi:LysM repeat protein